jgi:hypothetical protein
LSDLTQADQASPEEILANALQLYAALPPAARAATLDALRSPDPAAYGSLVRELVRTILSFQLKQRREYIRDQVLRGALPAVPDMSDEEAGAEAVRLIEESRERRAAARGGQ